MSHAFLQVRGLAKRFAPGARPVNCTEAALVKAGKPSSTGAGGV